MKLIVMVIKKKMGRAEMLNWVPKIQKLAQMFNVEPLVFTWKVSVYDIVDIWRPR